MIYYRLTIFLILMLSGCSKETHSNSVIIKHDTSFEDRFKIYQNLMAGICENEENIDRHFLQQTWYYSKEFNFFAYVFGTHSFSKHENKIDFSRPKITGIYCIDDDNIKVQYYKKDFVPGDLDLKNGTLKFDEKLTFLRQETIKVISINHQELILNYTDSNTEQSYYRKN